MSKQITNILTLTKMLSEYEGVTHWAISMRLFKKGDFISKLKSGADTYTRTAENAVEKFSEVWPEDLEWPSSVPRPSPAEA